MTGWRKLAACRGMGPDLFFPHPGDREAVEAARAVCAGCPVTGECGAATRPGTSGVWGGRLIREPCFYPPQPRTDRAAPRPALYTDELLAAVEADRGDGLSAAASAARLGLRVAQVNTARSMARRREREYAA